MRGQAPPFLCASREERGSQVREEEEEEGDREGHDKREEETARDKWAALRQVWLAERMGRRR